MYMKEPLSYGSSVQPRKLVSHASVPSVLSSSGRFSSFSGSFSPDLSFPHPFDPTFVPARGIAWLFRLQKYKKFESNSQQVSVLPLLAYCCFDCKSTKNLRAIHNQQDKQNVLCFVVSTAKVQKI